MNILFTGVGRRIELIQEFRKASLSLKKDLKIYGADLSGMAPALAYCDYARRVVPMRDPNYINNLLAICSSDKIDLVIPTIDTDLLILSNNRDRFEAIGTKVMISSPEMIRICRDKNYTSCFFIECGLRAPQPVNDKDKYMGNYPAFIKPKDGSSSINAHRVDNQRELFYYASQLEDYIIQPYVDGTEYTIDIFCDWYGNPISIVPRERVQVRAGEVLVTKICLDSKMIEEARAICEHFKPCGAITVQLIRDVDGIDWFIEINPRFGGGAPLSMKAGAKSAEAILKILDGECVGEYSVTDHAVYSRFDQSVCVNDENRIIRGVIFDLDDTLYSEREYVKSGFKEVSKYLEGDYEHDLWSFFSEGKPAIDELLEKIGRINEKEQALQVYRNHKPNIHCYPGVKEMIATLRERGLKVGIITDGRPEGQRNKLNALGLEIDDVIITDELGGEQFRKPCDIAFRIMIRRWRLDPLNVIYVGDNLDKDLQAPQQLGMKSVYFCNKDSIKYVAKASSESSISNITDLLKFLESH